jgi:multidrug resistance efflux pump
MRNNLVLIDDKDTKIELSELQAELESALRIIESYQETIKALREENNKTIRVFTHDLASPLQIVSMSLEALIDRSAPESSANARKNVKGH